MAAPGRRCKRRCAAPRPRSLISELPKLLDALLVVADVEEDLVCGRAPFCAQLRVAGVRHADTKGFAYSREDVDARSLANVYAQYLGQVFTHEMKPLEIEILVAELGVDGGADQLYHILYDGTVFDEERYTVLGGEAEAIAGRMDSSWTEGWTMTDALRAAVAALAGPDRTLAADELEVAALSRRDGRRAFRRIEDRELDELLGASPPP